MARLGEHLDALIETGEELAPEGGTLTDGYNSDLHDEYVSWRLQSIVAIKEVGDSADSLLRELEGDEHGSYFLQSSAQRVLGVLKAARAISQREIDERKEGKGGGISRIVSSSAPATSVKRQPRVFLVHGHDELIREQVTRFLEKFDTLEPIILSERANRGHTLIEKLTANKDVEFAVVLLTPDDVGKAAPCSGEAKPRARQNVVLELGFFLGHLGRDRVCVLFDESVEKPSDYDGVLYVKVDPGGSWRWELARELKAAALPVDMNKAIG